jgi:CheY-like chemotaxis protein
MLSVEHHPTDESGSLMAKKVWVVDDDPDIRFMVRLAVERGGFAVSGEAGDGFAATELTFEDCPDVVVLDYSMPRMNGAEAAQVIRDRCPNSKILAFSAFVERDAAWADRTLTKDRVLELVPMIKELVA